MNEKIPKIEKRKVYEANKHGYSQFILTLPKAFGEALKNQGEDSLIIAYDGVLIAFPANTVTEQELITFLKHHPELLKLIAKEAQK